MNSVDKSKSNLSQYSNTKSHISFDNAYSTLESVLEEKNRVIEKLKNRIHNQKIQLEFYIKKEINSPLMIEFSKSCLPELTYENMNVALAMNKFNRELGLKSHLAELSDRICNLAGQSNSIIQMQEYILNELIASVRQSVKPDNLRGFLGNFDINTNYIEVFNNLLTSTLGLKKSMKSFRSCCDRLISTEDKRNEIVEQVYSLPREERTICNYLVNIQMEKFELENTIRVISQKQKSMQVNVDELDIIENNLKVLHSNFNNFQCHDDDYCIPKMLEKIYDQAMSLLSLSREQREKYGKEIDQMKEENKKLRTIIQHIESRCTAKAEFSDIEKLHNVIKKTIGEARQFEKSKTDQLKQKSKECEMLKRRLSEVLLEKCQLQNLLDEDSSETKIIIDGSSFAYQAQLNKLQTIRENYSS